MLKGAQIAIGIAVAPAADQKGGGFNRRIIFTQRALFPIVIVDMVRFPGQQPGFGLEMIRPNFCPRSPTASG